MEEGEEAVQISGRAPFFLGGLGHIYGAAGREEDALQVICELGHLSKQRHVSPFWTGRFMRQLPETTRPFSGWNGPARNARRGWCT